jgi:hypothetical protein
MKCEAQFNVIVILATKKSKVMRQGRPYLACALQLYEAPVAELKVCTARH